ncbi:hypothetical protein DZB84_16575 [Bacillus sp. HNG]|nr:hypothetical protein DZB84_16575 [Bacillus sp. HNG]
MISADGTRSSKMHAFSSCGVASRKQTQRPAGIASQARPRSEARRLADRPRKASARSGNHIMFLKATIF